jgi:hypothetical protein
LLSDIPLIDAKDTRAIICMYKGKRPGRINRFLREKMQLLPRRKILPD